MRTHRSFHFPIVIGSIAAVLVAGAVAAQSLREAPADAPSHGRVAPAGEPGERLTVTGVVVDASGKPLSGVSLYIYQADREGYYGVKPVSNNRDPRLKLFLRSDDKGAWSFETVRPGSYPDSRVPGHIHFEVGKEGFGPRIFEIVFEGDPFVTTQMRSDPAYSVRPVEAGGKVTERIVLR
jgi:protocatechuate 3,4-dioxygenase beta subunit